MLSPVASTIFLLLINHINCYPFNFSSFNNIDDEQLLEFTKFITNLDIEKSSNFTPQLMEAYERFFTWSVFPPLDPEAFMNAKEIIEYHGYPIEEYTIETEDGYILTVQRIPYGKQGSSTQRNKPVLVQHGFAMTSAAWVINPPDKNLVYLLADAGFDVWLGNVRGNSYGYNHTNCSPEDEQFWQFSFDEMAKYDIPAVIEKILNVSGFKQINYIGHSMGTTILFALLSSQPEYNDIIKSGFLFAPVTSLHHIKSPFNDLAYLHTKLQGLIDILIHGKLAGNTKFTKFLATTICNSPMRFLCEHIEYFFLRYNPNHTNVTRYPVYLLHGFDSTSVQTLNHFRQLVYSKAFQYFDYGINGNLLHYANFVPPLYDMSQITAPMSLFWSNNDNIATREDVAALASQLRNVPLTYQVPDSSFNHLDFLWAVDVKALLYDKVIQNMHQHAIRLP